MEGLIRGRHRTPGETRRRHAVRQTRQTLSWCGRQSLRLPAIIRHTAFSAVDHDCMNVAQSTAYSAIVALFPALIVAAAVIPLLPYTTPLRHQLAIFFTRVLPSDVTPMLATYFAAHPRNPQTARAVVVAALVSLSGASSVVVTLMEGFRRAHDLPRDNWNFLQQRIRAVALVLLSLLPLGAVSLLVIFGHIFTRWLSLHLEEPVRTEFYLIALVLRWSAALLGSTSVIALIYHMGTPLRQPWRRVLPGAGVATVMWFLATIVFGWYVTRFANYSQVYGSLGAGIALLFWLYLVSLSVLCGAEFNAQVALQKTFPQTARTSAHIPTDG